MIFTFTGPYNSYTLFLTFNFSVVVVTDLTVIATTAPPLQGATPVVAPPMLPTQPKPSAMPSVSSAAQAYSAYGTSSVSKPIMRNDAMSGIIPIKALNPYSNKWAIKARITSKSDKRSWNNAKGSGTLFSIDLLDSEGSEIKATFFKEACEKFYPILESDRVYSFSGGKLKPVANPQYSTIKNSYEITFDQQSIIQPCDDDKSIEKNKFEFIKISDIQEEANLNKTVDVIAYVRSAGEAQRITSKNQAGKEFDKRDLTVVDDSGMEVKLTLWGDKVS